MTLKEFKENFSVGDEINGYAIGYGGVITAIGRKRFLYVNTWGKERVATIEHKDPGDWKHGIGFEKDEAEK